MEIWLHPSSSFYTKSQKAPLFVGEMMPLHLLEILSVISAMEFVGAWCSRRKEFCHDGKNKNFKFRIICLSFEEILWSQSFIKLKWA